MAEVATIGRVVHFVLGSGAHRPAIVVNAGEGELPGIQLVNLTVFLDLLNDKGVKCPIMGGGPTISVGSVPGDESGKLGTWHWPERAGLPKVSNKNIDNVKP